MTELQRTGFFREMPLGAPTDPSLADARHATASPHEDRLAAYLDAGHLYIATPGVTHDVFDPGILIGPPHYLTDGRFVWPGDLAHYVRTYHVRLDGRLVEHMLANGWAIPTEVDVATLALPARPGADPNANPNAGSSKPPDLAAAFANFIGALPGAKGPNAEAFKKSLETAGGELARAAEAIGDDLRRTLEAAGSRVRTALSSSLRTLSDWVEKPDEERAAQLQSLVASFQARFDEALAPQRRAEAAERAKQPSQETRGTVAQQPREHDLDPVPGKPDNEN